MKLLIDASNIRGSGGGVIHLKEFLSHANFERYGINEVIICSTKRTLSIIPESPLITKYSHELLEGGILQRYLWRQLYFTRILTSLKPLLFIPGTGSAPMAYPFVTMCRNLLPIDLREMNRFKYSKEWFRYSLLRIVHFRAYTQADGLICMNEYIFHALPIRIREKIKNLAIIPHGLNPIFKSHPKSNYELSNPIQLLYISRINLYKHQWVVAEAAFLLKEMGYNIKLSLVGKQNGYGREKLDLVIRRYQQYPEVVELHEEIPYGKLPQFYQNADIFIFASTCETFGLILLEAMGGGLPIICSNSSSMPEMLKDGGLYFESENSEELVSGVKKLILEKNLRELLGKKAHQLASKYDWEDTTNRTLEFITKTLKDKVN